ncbi:hypothetical protein HTZ84_04965 [Haloterrigena sp. SYSU A558-1]|uniref:Uncharacterized protein n=1 Tax=Haloterrigena gelatinilytica TaxID=2741724 RepID=A0ABX2L5Y4_9EURY|nr:hypothetical protein [Haloterrigena gelatinilytica]NUC71667.1 hypothetical protein [Haloterrigena gelatinilytica]
MSEVLAETAIQSLCEVHNRKAPSSSMSVEIGASGNLTVSGKLPSWLLGSGYIASYQQDMGGMTCEVVIARKDIPQFLAHLRAILRGLDNRGGKR